jgi:hypothetical protein
MRYPVRTLRLLGWKIGAPISVVSWCGHETVYVPHLGAAGWFKLVPQQ